MPGAFKKWLLLLLTALQLAVLSCGTAPGATTPTNTPTSATTLATTPTTTTPIITTPPVTPSPPLDGLAFESLGIYTRFDYDEYCNLGIQVHLMTDYHSLPDLFAYPSYPDYLGNDREKLNNVDFARYSVVFAFMGDKAEEGPPLTIEKLWRDGRTLYVQARFDRDNPRPYRTHPSATYRIPFDAVAVSKEGLPASGELKVVLLDQDGTTLATNTATIPEPADLLTLPVAFLPVMREAGLPAPGPLETVLGSVELEDDYLWFSPYGTVSKRLIIWPHGCFFQFERFGEYEISYAPLVAAWKHGVEVGASYYFQGCEIDAATAAEYIGQELPPDCGDSCWFVQDIQPVLT